MARIGVDVGGTNTDLVLECRRGIFYHKVPTTLKNQAIGVVDGVKRICEIGGIAVEDVATIVHGTTTATNITLEHNGAECGMLTTHGFRDILHIGRHKRPYNFSLHFDVPWQSQPLVKRRNRIAVRERILPPTGAVEVPLDEAGVLAGIDVFRKRGIRSVVIGFLFSFLNDAHEKRARELVLNEMPDAFVTLSSEVASVMREYERFSTAAMNCYVGPRTARYLRDLEGMLAGAGVHAHLRIMQSNGGVSTVEACASRPISILMSGPAGGVIGGASEAAMAGVADVITVDIGGTSADISTIPGGAIKIMNSRDTVVSGHPALTPMIDLVTIGAGLLRPWRRGADRHRRPGGARPARPRPRARRRPPARSGPGGGGYQGQGRRTARLVADRGGARHRQSRELQHGAGDPLQLGGARAGPPALLHHALRRRRSAARRRPRRGRLRPRRDRSQQLVSDIEAQIASARLGARRFVELLDQYGADLVFSTSRQLMAYAERLMRARIRSIPDGDYAASGHLDNDGRNRGRPLPVKVTLRVRGDGVEVDLTGSADQTPTAYNVPFEGSTKVAAYAAFRMLLLDPVTSDTRSPSNEGSFRPITVTAPLGSIFNPRAPASAEARFTQCNRMIDLILKALAPVLPDAVIAGSSASISFASYSGLRPDGRYWMFLDVNEDAYGGRPRSDGPDSIDNLMANTRNNPLEDLAMHTPMICDRYELRDDAPLGAGRFRGGIGVVKAQRVLTPAFITHESERHTEAPWGLLGGSEGAVGRCEIYNRADPAAARVMPSKFSGEAVATGDVMAYYSPNGGGYGDPLTRPPAQVLEDVLDGFYDIGHAREAYGVVLDIEDEKVDHSATEALRTSLKRG